MLEKHIKALNKINEMHYEAHYTLRKEIQRTGIAGLVCELDGRYRMWVDWSEREYMHYRVFSGRADVAPELEKYVEKCLKQAAENWGDMWKAKVAIEMEADYCNFYSRTALLMFSLRQHVLNAADAIKGKKPKRSPDYSSKSPRIERDILKLRACFNNIGFLQGRDPVSEKATKMLCTPGYRVEKGWG